MVAFKYILKNYISDTAIKFLILSLPAIDDFLLSDLDDNKLFVKDDPIFIDLIKNVHFPSIYLKN